MELEILIEEGKEEIFEIKEPTNDNSKIRLRDITWQDIKDYFAFVKKHGLFYSWEAPGKNKEMSTFYKFQTMVPSSEYHKDNLDPDKIDGNGKLKSDKGNGHDILKFAKFMSDYHIDELPQLYNVLKGDMKITGVRPMPLEQIKALFGEDAEKFMRLHFKYKPGLFGVNHAKGEDLKKKLFDYYNQKKAHYIKTDLKYFFDIWVNDILKFKKAIYLFPLQTSTSNNSNK